MLEKRRHVTTACQHCRRRKAKCSGEPPCMRCQKHKLDCKINTPTKKRGPAKAYNDSVEQKLRKLAKARTYTDLSMQPSTSMALPKIGLSTHRAASVSSLPSPHIGSYQRGPSSDPQTYLFKSLSLVNEPGTCRLTQNHRADEFLPPMMKWPTFGHCTENVTKEADICKYCPRQMPTSNPPTPPIPSLTLSDRFSFPTFAYPPYDTRPEDESFRFSTPEFHPVTKTNHDFASRFFFQDLQSTNLKQNHTRDRGHRQIDAFPPLTQQRYSPDIYMQTFQDFDFENSGFTDRRTKENTL